MNETEVKIVSSAEDFIKTLLSGEATGHDYFHSLRVKETALRIAEEENADRFTVALAAVLHDADDRKLFPDTWKTYENARRFLSENNIGPEKTEEILLIISEVSFKGTDSVRPSSMESACVQDADRLDALGAIGIARTFSYGGSRGRMLYDPSEAPKLDMNEEEYRHHVSSSVNHFYEKLFLLKDLMTTETGRKLAERRERFMKAFLEEFYGEWEGRF